jgi:DNA-binding transcriptional ArsR family regulator
MKNKSKRTTTISVSINSLDQQENRLVKDLEKIREIKDALSVLMKYDYQLTNMEPEPTPKISIDLNKKQLDQSGKNTIYQAKDTKKKIMRVIKSEEISSFSNIHEAVLKGPDTKYSPNTVRQYLSELKRSNKIKFDKVSKSYSVA